MRSSLMNNKFFCNGENKWQSLPRLHKYLAEGNGIMTSYLEVNSCSQDKEKKVNKSG